VTDTTRSTGQNRAARNDVEGQRKLNDRFNAIADKLTTTLGSFWALLASVLMVAIWALTGPIFHFSDTWQLFINTSTTVITFWMVFVIQNSANRDSKAVHLKLDELIRSVEGARNAFITLERAPEDTMAEKAAELAQIADDDEGAPLETPSRIAKPPPPR
jgi:low affinity Fe/Cu permease